MSGVEVYTGTLVDGMTREMLKAKIIGLDQDRIDELTSAALRTADPVATLKFLVDVEFDRKIDAIFKKGPADEDQT